jgi:MFS family permease
LIIITIATIFCATSASAEAGLSAIAFLGFWRLILGIGIGGDYPLSATITSEWAVANRRGQMIAAIFSMQGFGNVAAALVTIIVLACFKTPVENNVVNLDYVWRICIGLGAVPAVATIYARLTLPESPRYSADVIGDQKAARKALEDQKWVTPEDKERQHSMDANGHGAEYEKQTNGVETEHAPIEEDDSMYRENRIKQQQDFGAVSKKYLCPFIHPITLSNVLTYAF